MSDAGKWADLRARSLSGAAMAGVGIAAIWVGGLWFVALAIVASGLMLWELARMIHPERAAEAVALGVLGAAAAAIPLMLPGWGLLALGLPALASAVLPRNDKLLFAAYGTAVLVAAWGLVGFRQEHGMLWLIWLVLVVVVTDLAGYFAGRMIGGPKFWPRVSPKKTWSGTAAGWIAAALVGVVFLAFTTAGRDLIWISAALAFASQMGDAAESAIKRRTGVKDSSGLIPGHGGLLDRFDGLLGAALMMLIVAQFVVVPVVRL